MLNIVKLEEKYKWDSIAESFDGYDTYYEANYIESFSKFENAEAFLIYYKNQDFELCYPVEKYDIASSPKFEGQLEEGKYFDISTPYGYGGPLVKNYDASKMLFFINELQRWALENNIISQFFRFHPLLENHKYFKDFYNTKTFKKTVYIDLSDEDTIYRNMNDKCRNMIKKALKNNVEVKIDNSKQAQDTFKKLYQETMQKNNASDFYYFNDEFFDELFKTLGQNCNLFSAIYENNTASIALIYESKNYLHYHLSAANREYSKFGANNLLLFEVAKYGANKGLKNFHLGGGIEAEDGLFIFKKSFNKNGLVDFYIGRNIFDREKYDYLMQKRKNIDNNFNLETSYMIGYRA